MAASGGCPPVGASAPRVEEAPRVQTVENPSFPRAEREPAPPRALQNTMPVMEFLAEPYHGTSSPELLDDPDPRLALARAASPAAGARPARFAPGAMFENEGDEGDDPESLCVVCFDRRPGSALPCGHAHFCEPCSKRFMSCPLCRAPCATITLPDDGLGGRARPPNAVRRRPGAVAAPRQQSVLTEAEKQTLLCVIAGVWAFIFFGGMAEWKAEVPGRVSGDGHVAEACVGGGPRSTGQYAYRHYGCMACAPGWLQGGRGCYAHLEDLPPVQVGAALGGTFSPGR